MLLATEPCLQPVSLVLNVISHTELGTIFGDFHLPTLLCELVTEDPGLAGQGKQSAE